ncbi:hypothetical protein FI667_g2453, partial [Globisporangium splendens]
MACEPNPDILLYSYPEKKLRGKLQHGAPFEYSTVKFSRCGRRLVSLRAMADTESDDAHNSKAPVSSSGSSNNIVAGLALVPPHTSRQCVCVWDAEQLEPVKGCAQGVLTIDAAFLSFDPTNPDQFVIGGDDGMEIWKVYRGKGSSLLRHVHVQGHRRRPSPQQHRANGTGGDLEPVTDAAMLGMDEKRGQWVCHAWVKSDRFLAANKAGELVLVDAASATIVQVIDTSSHPTRSCIAGIVYMAESVVVAHDDGHILWLNEKHWDVMQSAALPDPKGSATDTSSATTTTSAAGSDSSSSSSNSTFYDGSGLVTSVVTSPNHSKVYIKTREGSIFELKSTVALDDDEEEETGAPRVSSGMRMSVNDGHATNDHFVVPCGSYPVGAVFASSAFTPSGGTLANGAIVASGGVNGRLYLWSIAKCRLVVEASVAFVFAHSPSAAHESIPLSSAGGSTSQISASSSGDSLPSVASLENGTGATSVIITALASRATDPVLIAGDHMGRLSAICVSKIVGGSGTVELIPLHSLQLLGGRNPLDILEMHSTQAVVLAASTRDNAVFLLSMDHKKHFQVIAYFALLEPNEHVVDVKWSVPAHNASALIVTCYSSRGLFYIARYQQTAAATSSSSDAGNIGDAAQQLAPKVVAFGEDTPSKCVSIKFLSSAPMSMTLAIAPQVNHLHVMKYKDMVLDPTEKLSVLSKVLIQDAHENGVAAMALYPRTLADGSETVATVGMNGAITVWVVAFGAGATTTSSFSTSTPVSTTTTGKEWQLEDIQAAKRKTIIVHSGPVASLMFVDIEDDLCLVSTGSDGCVFLLDVRVPVDAKPLRSSSEEPLGMNPLYINIVASAKCGDAFKPAQELDTKPFLQALKERDEFNARNRLKDQTRAQLNDLELKLKVLLTENDKLPETERLPRDEFVVNVEWRDQLVKENKERADRVRDGILKDLAKMNIVRECMKLEFWDSASVPGVRLRGLSPPPSMLQQGTGSGSNHASSNLFVYNFPMRRQTKQELLLAKKIELLRTIEFAHQQQEQEEQAAMTTTATAISQRETAWRRFQDVVLAPNVQWLIDAGIHHPSLNKWLLDKAKGSGGAALAKDKDKNAETPVVSLPASVNELQSHHLVYHPVAIHTRKQQRIRIYLLKSFVRFLVVAFNDEFDAPVMLKATKLDEIDAKSARIVEICTDLGLPTAVQDLYRPQWSPDEIAASIPDVKPEEMTQPKYETEAVRCQREKETAEKLELERQKDDVAGRALQDMMDGTLEVKKENLASQSLVKEPWMLEIPLDEVTAEQKELVAQQKFFDEKKYKKALDLELKKIRSEIQEICKGFDDKLRGLQETYLQMHRSVLVQHLHELRLAEDLLDYEHLVLRRDQIETAIRELQHAIQKCERENDVSAVQLEACKDEWHRAVEEDKACDRNFLKELDELVGSGAGVAPLEHDLVKHLVELFKKRKGDDLVRDHGDLGLKKKSGTKRAKDLAGMGGGSSVSLLTGGGAVAAKQRLLAEGLTSDPSARQLSAVTLLQSLQSSSSNNVNDGTDDESNVDPFQYLDFQQQQTPLRHFDSNNSVSAASQRHVVPLDYDNDRPGGVMIEDRVWRALNTLRTKEILAEHTAKERAEQYALAKSVANELRVQLSELHVALQDQHSLSDATTRQLDALADNAPLLVHIKQSQDESNHGGLPIEEQELLLIQLGTAMTTTRKDDDAFLVARASVESLNDVIQLHGKDQVGILSKIKNFRKNINIMEWEHTLLELQTKDMEERYTDIQLLRVTKDLQELFHTGDTAQKQAREIALLEAKMGHVGTHHASTLLKMDQTATKLHAQLRDRVRENQRFSEQVQQLQMQVQIREDILMNRKSAAVRHGTPAAGASSKAGENPQLKAIVVRRKLVDLAKAQTEEIEYLRMELDKMRRHTFPSFVQYQQHRQPDTKY